MRVTCNTATIADATLASCLAIHNESFNGVERAPEGVFRQNYSGGTVFTQEWYRGIVSFAIVTMRSGRPYLWTIATSPHARGKGFGQSLLREVSRWAKSMTYASIELTVKTDNPAQKLYFDEGYRVVSFLRRFYLDDGDGLLMRRIL